MWENLGYKLVRMTDILQINPHQFVNSPVYFVSSSHQIQFYTNYPTLEAKPDFGSHVTSHNQGSSKGKRDNTGNEVAC